MTTSAATRQPPGAGALIAVLAVLGMAATAAVVLGGQPPAERADSAPVRWPVADVHHLPDGLRRLGPAVAWGGALVLVGLWLVILASARRGRLGTRSVVTIAVAWATPLALGPPVLSADVYNYLGQGEMLRRGLDPYRMGISALGGVPVVAAVDPRWRDVSSPYGPLSLALSRLAAELGGGSLVRAVELLRLVAVVGVVVAVVACAYRARAGDRAMVVAVVALNPVMLLHLVGGAHLDGLGVGLIAAGLAFTAAGRPLPGLALATAAAAVKAPAAIVVATLGVLVVQGDRRGVVHRVLAVVGVVAVVGWGCALLVPHGFGWLHSLDTPGRGITRAAPTSFVAAGLSALFGLPATGTREVCRLLGLAMIAVAVGYLLATARRRDAGRTAGTGLLVAALLGPVSYVWYLAAPVAALAPVCRGRERAALVGLCAAAALTSLPSLSTPAFPWPPRPGPAGTSSPAPVIPEMARMSGSSRQAATPGTATPESLTRPPRVTATVAASRPSRSPGTVRSAAVTACRQPAPALLRQARARAPSPSRVRLNGLDTSESAAESRCRRSAVPLGPPCSTPSTNRPRWVRTSGGRV